MYLELLFRIVLSSSFCQVSLATVDISHHVLFVLFLFLARCDRMSISHLLLFPGFHSRHLPAPRSNGVSSSFDRSVSSILSLYAFTLALPVKVLSIIVLVRSRHSLLCGLIALPCGASAAQPREPRCQQTTRKTFLARPLEFFPPRSLAMEVPLLLLSAATFCVNCNSGATVCHGVPHKPSQFVASHASLSACLVQLLPRTTSFLAIHTSVAVQS